MGDFFKGWRRKTGVATLMLACVFMAGWVRSQYFLDSLNLDSNLLGKKITADFQSIKSRMGCNIHVYRPRDRDSIYLDFDYLAGDLRFNQYSRSAHFHPQFDWGGFLYGTIIGTIHPDTNLTYDTMLYHVPYWFIVIPMTLLSSYLLLSMPRSRTASAQSRDIIRDINQA